MPDKQQKKQKRKPDMGPWKAIVSFIIILLAIIAILLLGITEEVEIRTGEYQKCNRSEEIISPLCPDDITENITAKNIWDVLDKQHLLTVMPEGLKNYTPNKNDSTIMITKLYSTKRNGTVVNKLQKITVNIDGNWTLHWNEYEEEMIKIKLYSRKVYMYGIQLGIIREKVKQKGCYTSKDKLTKVQLELKEQEGLEIFEEEETPAPMSQRATKKNKVRHYRVHQTNPTGMKDAKTLFLTLQMSPQ